MKGLADAHRHLGVLPPFGFYGGTPVNPDLTARATITELIRDLDRERTERALVIPNYGIPDVAVTFALNDLVLDAADRDDRIKAGLFVSPRPQDAALNDDALSKAGEPGVAALKTTFLLGGSVDDPACEPELNKIFAAAAAHALVVHVHTSPGSTSDIDAIGSLVERYGDSVKIHLVHLGGGMSGHIKLINSKFFDWIAAGKQVYTDTSWAIGFAPRWLAAEIDRRGIGADRLLFASDEPWGDHAGELARLQAAAGDGELAQAVFTDNFEKLYG